MPMRMQIAVKACPLDSELIGSVKYMWRRKHVHCKRIKVKNQV